MGEEHAKSKYATAIWVAVAVVAVIIFLATNVDVRGLSKKNEITVVVDYGDGKQQFSGNFVNEMRVWDLLQQATAISNTTLMTSGNFKLESIGGHRNGDSGKQWVYYVNDRLQSTPPFETMVSSGDKIEFKFE